MLAVQLSVLFMIGGAYGSAEVYQYFDNVLNTLRLSKEIRTTLADLALDDFPYEFDGTITDGATVKSTVNFKDGHAMGLTKPKRVKTCHAPYYGTAGKSYRCSIAFDNLKIEYRECDVTYGDIPKVAFKTNARVSRMVFSVEVSKGKDAPAVTDVEFDRQDYMLVRFEGLGPLNAFERKIEEGFRTGLAVAPLTKIQEELKNALVEVVKATPFPE